MKMHFSPRGDFRHCNHAAFTLVELLVVMTIIGLLMSLLIPAVNSARESGRRNTCLSNIKQLATAAMKYNDRRRELPGYVDIVGKSSDVTKANIIGTWPVMLFPDIERTDIYHAYFAIDPAKVTEPVQPLPSINLLICPSDPPEDLSVNPTALSYVANCGIPDNGYFQSSNTSVNTTIFDSAAMPWPPVPFNSFPGSPRYGILPTNGMFYDHYSPTYTGGPVLTSSLDHIPDGANNTLLFSENFMPTSRDVRNGLLYRVYYPPFNTDFYKSGNNYLLYPNPPVLNPTPVPVLTIETASLAAFSYEADIGFVWDTRVVDHSNPALPPSDPRRINGDKDRKNVATYLQNSVVFEYYYSRPSSSHPNGVNVAMCGGECFFLREDIDYWVYEQLMTPDGKHSQMTALTSSGAYAYPFNAAYNLDDADYK